MTTPPADAIDAKKGKMKIAMFAWESLHSISVGGIAQHVTELAAAMQRRGHEVHVYTRGAEGQEPYEEIYGVCYHRVFCTPGEDFVESMKEMCNSMVWSFGETVQVTGPFDVVHAHDWMVGEAMVQCRNTHNVPKCVFSFHSTEKGRSGSEDGGSEQVLALEGQASFVADRIVAVSDKLKSEVCARYEIPDSKCWFIPNGISCARFDGFLDDPGAIKAKYDIGPLDPIVLFVGRMVGGMKGGDILIEAVPKVLGAKENAKFVFVGDGDNKMHCDFRAQEMDVSHACRFLGPKSGQELIDLYKVCDVVTIPSRYEPFGLVVLEAWSAGKPVVASDRVGCPVDHGSDGFVCELTPDGLAWGINELFSDFDRARKMGATGRTKAAFSFSWDKVAETTEECYNF